MEEKEMAPEGTESATHAQKEGRTEQTPRGGRKKRDAERSQSGKVNKMSSNQKMNRQEQGRPETNI